MEDWSYIAAAVVLGVGFLFLIRRILAWQIRRAVFRVMEDLTRRGATSREGAVSVTYARRKFIEPGFRDYRPVALELLLRTGVVEHTPEGGYYLTGKSADSQFGK